MPKTDAEGANSVQWDTQSREEVAKKEGEIRHQYRRGDGRSARGGVWVTDQRHQEACEALLE